MRKVSLFSVLVLLGLLPGCRQELGLPRTALLVASPDGRAEAAVRNHPSLDPPRQTLWLRRSGDEDWSQLRRLPEDQSWCDRIVWSQDSRRVGFLIDGRRLVVFDAVTQRELPSTDLPEGPRLDGSGPPT